VADTICAKRPYPHSWLSFNGDLDQILDFRDNLAFDSNKITITAVIGRAL
jgi:hypothetical protein